MEKKHKDILKEDRNLPENKDKFHQLCHTVVKEECEKFKVFFNSIGLSFDWNLQYSTISDEVAKISQASFIRLYNEGKIYMAQDTVIWDTVNNTAIAQSEVEDKNSTAFMYNINFEVINDIDKSTVQIATTRPELLPACVALFYHPDDDRYKKLEGKKAKVPFFDCTVPILADEKVKIDKGTGLVMCCTYGDFTDVFWQKTHNLEVFTMINGRGRYYSLIECLQE